MHITESTLERVVQISSSDHRVDFFNLRHEMLNAFLLWAQANPLSSELAEEINGTVNALWGIAAAVNASKSRGMAQ